MIVYHEKLYTLLYHIYIVSSLKFLECIIFLINHLYALTGTLQIIFVLLYYICIADRINVDHVITHESIKQVFL